MKIDIENLKSIEDSNEFIVDSLNILIAEVDHDIQKLKSDSNWSQFKHKVLPKLHYIKIHKFEKHINEVQSGDLQEGINILLEIWSECKISIHSLINKILESKESDTA